MTPIRKRTLLTALVGLAWFFLPGHGRSAPDAGPATVVRVEEDWQLVVCQPNPQVASPQVATQMKRSPDAGRFCNLHLNACDLPSLSLGGMQLQVWNDSTNLANKTGANNAILNTPNEVITWTQYLKQDAGQLKFGISAAASDTWGDFSGLEVTAPGASISLDSYSADYSVKNSGVTFGANRVASFKLVAVRLYYSNGTVATDSTERVVYAAPGGDAGNP
jgi:hypothetical protein